MTELVFVDSNILIYAHDADAGNKRHRARDRLQSLWSTGYGRVSIQVLQEVYVNATLNLTTPIARASAREVVAAYGTWVRETTTVATVTRASHLAELAQVSFWDALIVAAAEQAGATVLLSEDFQAGQAIAGIRVENPLLAVGL